MKYQHQSMKPGVFRIRLALSTAIITISSLFVACSAEVPRSFATPEEAVRFLADAVATTNRVAFQELFGVEADVLANPDSVQGANELAEFASALNTANRLVKDSETRMTLEVGKNHWPLPIPLICVDGSWRFDGEDGVQELLNRRIGQNELDTLKVLRTFVAAQREYASEDRDGDDVLEYAQRLASSPGRTDGLFWPPELNGEISPLGPLVAYAQAEGYSGRSNPGSAQPRPFHGYLFKILNQQSKHAPGGKYNYVINGNMIGGFAAVAWPAEYGSSGIMTFIVNHQGKVYQQDLGMKTDSRARRISAYDPGKGWSASRD